MLVWGRPILDPDEERVREAFNRRLLKQEDRTLVQSTCNYCGVRIVGSAVESLAQDERDHLQRCAGAKTRAADTQR